MEEQNVFKAVVWAVVKKLLYGSGCFRNKEDVVEAKVCLIVEVVVARCWVEDKPANEASDSDKSLEGVRASGEVGDRLRGWMGEEEVAVDNVDERLVGFLDTRVLFGALRFGKGGLLLDCDGGFM